MDQQCVMKMASVALCDKNGFTVLHDLMPVMSDDEEFTDEDVEVMESLLRNNAKKLSKIKPGRLITVKSMMYIKDFSRLYPNYTYPTDGCSREDFENLCSFIMESSTVGSMPKRYVCYGSLYSYSWFRRELSDYGEQAFYAVGDIVTKYNDATKYVIVCNYQDIENEPQFTNKYDLISLDGKKKLCTDDTNVHRNEITAVIGHDLQLAKSMIQKYSYYYKDEYLKEIL